MLLIGVQFNGNNRIYYYKSPYALHIGQQVTVNVAGESKVVKVVDNDVDEDDLTCESLLISAAANASTVLTVTESPSVTGGETTS